MSAIAAPRGSQLPLIAAAPVVSIRELLRDSQNGLSKRQGDSGEPVPVLRLANVVDGAIEESDARNIRLTEKEITKYALEPGDLLCIRVNGSRNLVGRVVPFIAQRRWAYCDHFIRLRPDHTRVDSRYLAHYLDTRVARRQIELNMVCSAGQNTVSQGTMLDLPVPLPDLARQRAIVAVLEKQFSRLDEGVANLKRAKANLTRQQASVLQTAVEGTLTVHVGRARPGQLNAGDPLQVGWSWCVAEELACPEPGSIGAGPFGTIFKAKDFRPQGVPIIFLRHVAPMRYSQEKPGFMDAEKWEQVFRPYSVFGGELLITKLGEPPGVCATYPMGVGPAMVTPDVIKMRVDPRKAVSTYLMYYFNSEVARRFATGAAFGTTRTRLTLPLFRQMPIVVPPLDEQHHIVAEVDRRLSIVREVEAEVDANLKRAQALRNAVLADAFQLL